MQRNCIEQGGRIQGERVDREQLQHGYRDGHDREPETQIEGDTAVGRSVFVSIEHAQAYRERHQNHRRDQYLARPRLDPESLSHMTIRPWPVQLAYQIDEITPLLVNYLELWNIFANEEGRVGAADSAGQ